MAKAIENSHGPFCAAITTAVGCLTMSNIRNIFATNKVLDTPENATSFILSRLAAGVANMSTINLRNSFFPPKWREAEFY